CRGRVGGSVGLKACSRPVHNAARSAGELRRETPSPARSGASRRSVPRLVLVALAQLRALEFPAARLRALAQQAALEPLRPAKTRQFRLEWALRLYLPSTSPLPVGPAAHGLVPREIF